MVRLIKPILCTINKLHICATFVEVINCDTLVARKTTQLTENMSSYLDIHANYLVFLSKVCTFTKYAVFTYTLVTVITLAVYFNPWLHHQCSSCIHTKIHLITFLQNYTSIFSVVHFQHYGSKCPNSKFYYGKNIHNL